jgi:hypothetical protein
LKFKERRKKQVETRNKKEETRNRKEERRKWKISHATLKNMVKQ